MLINGYIILVLINQTEFIIEKGTYINMNKMLLKYSNEINMMKNYFLNFSELSDLCGILIYGSASNESLFDSNYSDIDVIVFLQEFENHDISNLIKKIKCSGLSFGEKNPQFICDSLCSRVEFYYCTPTINFDITISGGLIPDKKQLIEDACYDSFEALMGGVYVNAQCIYGRIPDESLFEKEFYPFYNDDLRNLRLQNISERIRRYNTRIKCMWEKEDVSALDHVYKLRKLLVKYIFIINRKYYYTPEKNVYYQLSTMTDLPDSDIRTISLMDDCDYKQLIIRFTSMVDRILNDGWSD